MNRKSRAQAVARLTAFAILTATLTTAGSAADKKKKHFLWKIESDKATVYLLGSVHAAKKELYPLDKVIEDAFDKSDKVVFEVSLDLKTQLEAATKLVAAARYPQGEKLRKNLDDDTRKLLEAYLKEQKRPVASLDGFRPWFAAITITMAELQKHGYSPLHGVDQYFQKKATAKKKPVSGLETVDDQVGLFKGMKPAAQAKMLKQTLAEADKIGKTLDGLFETWKKGDAKQLDKLMLEPMRAKEYKQLYKSMFVDRNVNMAKKIEGFLKTKSTYFVVVGAGHLVSKEGIIAMLKAKKYTITQL